MISSSAPCGFHGAGWSGTVEPENVAPRNNASQHLKGNVVIVGVIVVVDVAIVEVDIGVARRRSRGRPVVVVVPARRHFAFSLFATRGRCVVGIPASQAACTPPTFNTPPEGAVENASNIPYRPLLIPAVTETPMRRRTWRRNAHLLFQFFIP